MIDARFFANFIQSVLGNARFGKEDIFLDTPFENPGILQHHTENIVYLLRAAYP